MRTQLTTNNATTYYLYDDEAGGGVPVAELAYAGTTTSLQYLNGTCADGWRLRYVGGVAYVETYDPQGSIVQSGQDLAAGQTQYARATYCYDGFGGLRGRWSSAGSTTNVHQDPAGFGGQYGYYQDLQTGLEHLGARYYDGGTGRFVTRDPIGYGGGQNLYAFCGNNPINESDPNGTSDSSDFGLGELKSFGNFAAESLASVNPLGSFAPERLIHPFQAGKHASEAEKDGLTFGAYVAVVGSFLTPAGAEGAAKINCFVAGTLVQMADGTTKKIEDVREGDIVVSRNPETGVMEAKSVVSRSVKAAERVLTLTLVDSTTHLTQTITCTPGHPFYVQGQGFVLAGSLGIGTCIVTRAGPCLSVTNIAYEPKSAGGVLVYNFTVEDDHTYFVGTLNGGTWVHNDSIKVVLGEAGADLAETARLHRTTNGAESAGNLAVFEYKNLIGGQEYLQRMVFSSGGEGKLFEHSEQRGVRYFEKRGMLGSITRVYSERHPCPGTNGCNNLLNRKLPGVPVYYSVPHGGLGR